MSVPVLLVTGFLGSGKTTLLNRMLARRPASEGGRWAIIVNELGAIGIDGDLLPGDMTRQVELPGGCICCVLNEDLDRTVIELLEANPDLELLVIETTGVAEPMPIAWTLEADSMEPWVRLRAVVTVVDAVNHEAHRPESPAVDAQVDYADVLLVSKLDQLGVTEPPPALASALRQRNPEAPILGGDADALADAMWALMADPATRERDRHAGPRHEHRGHQHGPLHGVSAVSLAISDTLDFEELADALEALPARYLRIKGIARVIDRTTGSDEPHFVAFHRVGQRVSRDRLDHPAEPRLVALGRDLRPAELAACLDAAVVTCPPVGG